MVKEGDCVELGFACAKVCQALDRGINGRQQEQLSQSVLNTIERLKTCVKLVTYTPDNLLTKLPIIGLLA